MNNFFDYNIDTKQYNGSAYEVSSTSEALWQEWLEINKKYEKCITNYQGYLPFDILPMPLQILTIIGMILFIPYFSLIICFPYMDQIIKNSPNVPWELIKIVGIVEFCVTIPLVLFLIVMKIRHNKKDHSGLRKERTRIQIKICKEFNISEYTDLQAVDVLSVEYRENGTEKTICKKYQHRYKVQEWEYFLFNDTLYFTDYKRLFAIELSKIRSMSTEANRKIYTADSTKGSDRANISCFIPGYYAVKGYGSIQISDTKEQFDILVPVYDWENNGIKAEIEEYRKALKVYTEQQREIILYRDDGKPNWFIAENIEWSEYCDCCVELIPATLQEEDIEQVKVDFLSIIHNTSAWDEKLMPLIEETTGKGKAAYNKDEFGLIGFQVKSKHRVSFWYDMNEDYIEISGSIENDMWTVSKRESCSMLE